MNVMKDKFYVRNQKSLIKNSSVTFLTFCFICVQAHVLTLLIACHYVTELLVCTWLWLDIT